MKKKIMLRKLNAFLMGGSLLAVPALYSGPDDASPNQVDQAVDDTHTTLHDEQMMDQASNQDRSRSEMSQRANPNERRLDQLIGASVQDIDGARLGAIDDLIVDRRSGKAEFAIIETDNWLDDRRAIVPVEKLQAQSGETSAQVDPESQLSLDIEENKFDQLAGVELDRSDLTRSIEGALDSINETFNEQIDRNEIANTDYRLASELSDMSAAANQEFTSVDHIVVDFANGGEYQYVLSDAAGTSYRVPGRDVTFADREHITLTAPAAINSYPVYMNSSARVIDSNSLSSNAGSNSNDQSNETERFDRDSSSSDAYSRNGDMDSSDSSETYASADQGESGVASGDKTQDPDRVYSSNGLVDQGEESQVERVGEAESSASSSDSSSIASSDRQYSAQERSIGEEADSESYSAKQQWNSPAGSRLSDLTQADRLVGLSVRDANGERLGKISDALVSSENGQVAFAIVETDNWFDGRAALVPVQSLYAEYGDGAETGESIDRVSISLSEDEFDELATYDDEQDVSQFLSINRSAIVSKFKVNEKELPSDSARFIRASELKKE